MSIATMPSAGFFCSRKTLVVLNILYVLLGVLLISFGAYGHSATQMVSLNIVVGVIVCGVILILISIVGLFGTMKHNQVMLFFYMVLLFLLFLIQFSVSCACLALNEENQNVITTNAWIRLDDPSKLRLMRRYECCGFQDADVGGNYTLGHPPCNLIPLPCCSNSRSFCCQGLSSTLDKNETCPCSNQLCWPRLHSQLNSSLKVCGAFGLIFSFVEILGVWLAMRYRNQRNPNADPGAFL